LFDDTEVLDRALAVLVERGPQFTLPEVGRAVGLSASTLIQRFGSKRAMLDRVLERATVRLEDA
jgi:AcrR family transcriptional regulator